MLHSLVKSKRVPFDPLQTVHQERSTSEQSTHGHGSSGPRSWVIGRRSLHLRLSLESGGLLCGGGHIGGEGDFTISGGAGAGEGRSGGGRVGSRAGSVGVENTVGNVSR